MNSMNEKIIKEELAKYKRQYKIIVDLNKQMESEIAANKDVITLLTQNLENAQKALDIQKNLGRQMSAEWSKKEQGLIEFMNCLKNKLREMGYDGDFDRLGK